MPGNKRVDIRIILNCYGIVVNEYNQIKCLYHEDNNPSSFVMTGNNALYCNSCKRRTTIQDLVKIKEQEKGIIVSSDKHAWRIAYSIVEEFERKGCKIPEIKKNEGVENKENIFEKRKYLCSDFNEAQINKYLMKRGILPGNLKHIYTTLEKNNVNLGVDKLNQFHIFFNRFKYCIYRRNDLDKNVNAGNSTPVILKKGSNKLVIVEGIFDALSLLQFKDINIDICTLNSVSNAKKFLAGFQVKVENFEKRYEEIFLVLDNDNAGDRTTQELLEVLQNTSKKIRISDYRECFDKKYKDINEHITENKSIVFDTNIYETRIIINCANRIKKKIKDRLCKEESLEFLDEEIIDREKEFEKIVSISEYECMFLQEKLEIEEKEFETVINQASEDNYYFNEVCEDVSMLI